MKPDSSTYPLAPLYRNKRFFVSAALLLLLAAGSLEPPTAGAQRKKETGPRAVAVLTWNGDDPTPTPGTSVLTPVAIRAEGRYYDAELYQAQPEPLAVESGVVYDVLKSGEVIGTFTVGAPRERDSVWYGTGAFEKKGGKEQAAKNSPAKPAAVAEPEDERPKLRRGAPPPPAPKEQTDEVLNNIDRDPARPTLRRHTAEERKAQSSAPVKEFVPPAMHMVVAVSDAGGPEPRPFTFRAKAGEVDLLRASMEKLARQELQKSGKPQVPASKAVAGTRRRAPAPDPIVLENSSLGIFDVNSNNAPILVYSATSMVDGAKKYITVAAWEEIDQSLRKVFAQITDDKHLDVYPRLEVIDAVDASGNGRGELLFRAFGDQGSRFLLYHPGPDSLNLLFDSARG